MPMLPTGTRAARGASRLPLVALLSWVSVLVPVAGCGHRATSAPARGFNLLLITLDTVRADHLGAYGDADAETPALDRLAGEGVRFARAMTAAPLTLPAHATLLSGLLPPHHGLHGNGAGSFPAGAATLATDLEGEGYRTGAFVGAFVLDHRFGLARGFETYDDEIDRGDPASPGGLEAERPGRVVVDRALAWLGRDDPRPFFAWVHLYDAHAPYEPPEPYRSRHAGHPYDGEIAEVDEQVERLLAFLAERGLAAQTVVAAVGDHGESLGEHGELTHGLLLYQGTLRVPLIVAAPGHLRPGGVVAAPVGGADLAPTLAGLLGRPLAPAAGGPPLDGRDLSAPLLRGEEPPAADLYAETEYPASFGWSPLYALRRGDAKYIAAPRPELYDLAADPGEADNLLASRRRQAGELAAELTAVRASASAAPGATPALDDEARARLASLGYAAPRAPAAAGADGGAARDPKDAVALFRGFEEAHWALGEGRADDARKRLEELVSADPGNPVFRATLARACRERGDLPRAIALYREAVAQAPADADGWYNLAVTLQQAGKVDDAVTALAAAIERDPKRPEAHNALGIAYAASGRLEDARRAFAEAVALDPRNARAYNNLGNALRDLGRRDEAEAAYRKAIELAPRYPDPLNGLGVLEVAGDRPAEALPLFDRALALDPQRHEVRLNRAIALELAGDRPAAIAACREFLSAAADDPEFTRQRRTARQLLAQLTQGG
jgi:arylsulfatase A-like enzyme/Tfp pilus assembly protein PilF